MSKAGKIKWIIVALVLIGLVTAGAAAVVLTQPGILAPLAGRLLSDGDQKIDLADLAWRFRPLTVIITKASLKKFASGLAVEVDKAVLEVDLSGWASGRIRIVSVELDKPRLNWSPRPGTAGPAAQASPAPAQLAWPGWLAGARLKVRQAEATVTQPGLKFGLTGCNAALAKGALQMRGTVSLAEAGQMSLTGPLSLTGSVTDLLRLDGRFSLEDGTINSSALAGRLTTSGRLIAGPDRIELIKTIARLDLDRFDPAPVNRIDLALSGAWDRAGRRDGGRIELTELNLAAPGLARLSGRLVVDPDRPNQPQGKLTGELTDLAGLSGWLGPDWLNRLRPKGRLPLSLTADQTSGQAGLVARLDLSHTNLRPIPDGPERRLAGRLTVIGPWQWPLPRDRPWTATGRVDLAGLLQTELDLAWTAEAGLSGQVKGQVIDLAAWAGLAPAGLPAPAGSLPFNLTAPADGSPWRADLTLDHLTLAQPGADNPAPLAGRLELSGPSPFSSGAAQSTYSLIGQVGAASGRVEGKADLLRRGAAWELGQYTVSGRIDRFRDWLDLAGLEPNGPWAGLTLSGPVPFELAGRGEALDRAALDLTDLVVHAPGLGAKVKLTGRLGAAGSATTETGYELSGDLKAEADWAGSELKLTKAALTGRLSGRWPGRTNLEGRFKLPAGGLIYRGQPIDPGDLTGAVRLESDQVGAWSIRLTDPAATGLGKLSGSIVLNPKGPSGKLKADGLDLAGLIKLIDGGTGSGLAGWSPGGSIKAMVEIKPGTESPAWRAEADLSQVALASPDGRIMVQGGAGKLNLIAPTGADNARLDLALTGGQALWDTVFVDLTKHGLTARASVGRIRPDRLTGLNLNLDFPPYGRIDYRGAVLLRENRPAPKGRLTLTNLDAAQIYQAFIKDTLVAVRPDLGDFRPGGLIGADLDLIPGIPGKKGCRLKGRLKINQAVLAGLPGGGADKINLDLPVDYILGGRPADPAQPEKWGWLEINGLSAGPVAAQRLAAPIALVPNRLLVKGRLGVGIMNGRLRLRDIEIDQPLSPDFRATARAAWGGIDLGALSQGGIRIKGRLSGDLGRIELSRQSLTIAHPLIGDLFGGALTVSKVSLERPFSPGRLLRTDATVRRLDLEQLSRALDFGRVTGRFDVEATDLRIAYGQAVGMNLTGRSVSVEGVSRTVSLKAVNSISVIGSGSGIEGVGYSIMKPFFQEFPYDKIGFGCTLKNDTFTVRGLIRENGVEYLVKKPLLTGINVINANPDNRIGFKDMIRRLRRVIGNLNESEAK